jgi:hypothetical protein
MLADLSYAYLASLAASVAAGGGRVLWLQRQARSQADERDKDLKTIRNSVDQEGGLEEANNAAQQAADRYQEFSDQHGGTFSRDDQEPLRELTRMASEASERARQVREKILDECPPGTRVGDLAGDAKLRAALLGRKGSH